MPHILYIGQAPAEGMGSPVIVLRHLQRLAAAGWLVSIISEPRAGAGCLRADWPQYSLPLRRPWWPPLRQEVPGLRALRHWLLAGEVRRLVASAPPDAVLGYLAAHDDFLAEVASAYARRSGLPLTLLVHDDAAAFTPDETEKHRLRTRHATMLRRAHRRWFVSPELAAPHSRGTGAAEVLPPLPAGWPRPAQWRAAFAKRPRVYYAGSLWPVQLSLLRQLAQVFADHDVDLVLLTRETPALAELLESCPVQHLAPFATNREALDHLAEHAAGVLISYAPTVAEMPWIATSFPSKLIEYVQLGLPCAVVAPSDSAVGRWAGRTGYTDFFNPNDLPRLAAWACALHSQASWQTSARHARVLATGEFNPERIHAVFAADLLRP